MATVGENRALRDQYNAVKNAALELNNRYTSAYSQAQSSKTEALASEFSAIESEARSLVGRLQSIQSQNSSNSQIFDPTLAQTLEGQLSFVDGIANNAYTARNNITRELETDKNQAAGEKAEDVEDAEDEDEELDEEEKDNLDEEDRDPDDEPLDDEQDFDEPDDEEEEATDDDSVDQTDGVSSTDSSKSTVNQKPSVPRYDPLPNPLSEYASQTYNLSLFVLDKIEYKGMVTGDAPWNIGKCLIGGAGRYQSSRAADFGDDFYFDNLRLTTVVGLNARSKSSNAIEISFTIVEPYGLTLLDRIIAMAPTVESKCRNYLELPYVLQLDFFGSKDLGEQDSPILGHSKRFAIKIIEMKMKVGTKGTEYAIKAIPFNHQGLQDSIASTPVNLEVVAGTVGEFFADQQADLQTQISNKTSAASSAEEIRRDIRYSQGDEELIAQLEARLKEVSAVAAAAIRASSYAGGVNAWLQYQIDTGARKFTDKVRFSVDSDIASASIVMPGRNDPSKTPVPVPGTEAAKKINTKNAAGPDFTTGAFNVPAGTSILKLIDMVMRNSAYVLNQVRDPASRNPEDLAEKLNKPLYWYKVIPEIQLDDFDPSTNRWAKTVTYHIVPHIVYNSKHPYGPQINPLGAVKEYHYIYTGQNTEILDFNIEFNALYYTAVELNRAGYQTLAGTALPPELDSKDNSKINSVDNPSRPGSVIQQQITFHSDDPGASAGLDGNRNSASKSAAGIQKSIYTEAKGDMLSLRLKIIGDPHFIKQDDITLSPANPDYEEKTKQQLIPGLNSLVMDRGELFCRVTFRTPVDIDETTGLVRHDGKYIESKFSGLFRILRIESDFRSGKFEQTLDLVRQPEDVTSNMAKDDSSRDKNNTDDGNSRDPLDDTIDDPDQSIDIDDETDNDRDIDDDPSTSPYGEENDLLEPEDPEESDLRDIVDNDEEVPYDDDVATANSSQENQPVNNAGQLDQQKTIADSSPANSSPTGDITPPAGVTRDPNSGAYTYKDITGTDNYLTAGTNDALQAQVQALKDGNTVTYVDYDRNSGWVTKTYDPQAQTYSIVGPATEPKK